jgi:hypothetical protein
VAVRLAAAPRADVSGVDRQYAHAHTRDRFLDALEARDGATLARLARDLTGCGNPLPSAICVELGLPPGSTYGTAARSIAAR